MDKYFFVLVILIAVSLIAIFYVRFFSKVSTDQIFSDKLARTNLKNNFGKQDNTNNMSADDFTLLE